MSWVVATCGAKSPALQTVGHTVVAHLVDPEVRLRRDVSDDCDGSLHVECDMRLAVVGNGRSVGLPAEEIPGGDRAPEGIGVEDPRGFGARGALRDRMHGGRE